MGPGHGIGVFSKNMMESDGSINSEGTNNDAVERIQKELEDAEYDLEREFDGKFDSQDYEEEKTNSDIKDIQKKYQGYLDNISERLGELTDIIQEAEEEEDGDLEEMRSLEEDIKKLEQEIKDVMKIVENELNEEGEEDENEEGEEDENEEGEEDEEDGVFQAREERGSQGGSSGGREGEKNGKMNNINIENVDFMPIDFSDLYSSDELGLMLGVAHEEVSSHEKTPPIEGLVDEEYEGAQNSRNTAKLSYTNINKKGENLATNITIEDAQQGDTKAKKYTAKVMIGTTDSIKTANKMAVIEEAKETGVKEAKFESLNEASRQENALENKLVNAGKAYEVAERRVEELDKASQRQSEDFFEHIKKLFIQKLYPTEENTGIEEIGELQQMLGGTVGKGEFTAQQRRGLSEMNKLAGEIAAEFDKSSLAQKVPNITKPGVRGDLIRETAGKIKEMLQKKGGNTKNIDTKACYIAVMVIEDLYRKEYVRAIAERDKRKFAENEANDQLDNFRKAYKIEQESDEGN